MTKQRKGTGIGYLMIVSAFLVLLPSLSAVDVTTCPIIINDSSNLTQNVNGSSCITFGASNIELNCNSFNITATPTGSGTGITAGNRTNVTIRNCFVYNFTTNLYLDTVNSSLIATSLFGDASDTAILALNVSRSNFSDIVAFIGPSSTGTALMARNVSHSRFTNVTSQSNGSNSFIIMADSSNVTIERAVGNGTRITGLRIEGANDITVLNSNGSSVNETSASTASGVFVIRSRNIILENVLGLSVSGNGIRIVNVSNITVINSTGRSNISDGIDVQVNSSNVTLYNVTGVSTLAHGLNASADVISLLINNAIFRSEAGFGLWCSGCNMSSFTNVFAYSQNRSGMMMESTIDSNFTLMNITGMGQIGLVMNNSHRNRLVNLSIVTPATGLQLLSSQNNTFANVTIYANGTWMVANGSLENNMTDLRLDNPNASIRFFSLINISSPTNVSRSHVNLSFNLARVNGTNLSFLNVTSEITLRDLVYSKVLEIFDENENGTFATCASSRCTRVSYTNGILMFNVSGWSAYSSQDNTPLPQESNGGNAESRPFPSSRTIAVDESGTRVTTYSYDTTSLQVGDRQFIYNIIRTDGYDAELVIGTAQFRIGKGESKDIDADGDGSPDVRVTLEKLLFQRADITIVPLAQPIKYGQKKAMEPKQTASAGQASKEEDMQEQQPSGAEGSTSAPSVMQSPTEVSPFRSLTLRIAMISVLVLAALAALIVVSWRRNQKSSPAPADATIRSYITRYRNMGYSSHQIAEQLRKYHAEADVLAAFNSLDRQKMIDYIKQCRSQGFSDTQIQSRLGPRFLEEEIHGAFSNVR